MAEIIGKRMTAELDGEFAVFLIGARINRWWRIDQWWPVARAMRRMIRELEEQPARGLLGFESWGGRTTIMVQYWRSAEHLFEYARAKDAQHLPGWQKFRRLAARTDAVGVWHETYLASAGTYESIYHHMPRFGLGAVGELVEASGHRQRARDRLSAAAS